MPTSKTPLKHLPHPTDERRTVGRHFRTACGRWAGLVAFLNIAGRPACPKCVVAQLLHELEGHGKAFTAGER